MNNKRSILPWAMLSSRLILFIFFQACFALAFFIMKSTGAWDRSLPYWLIGIILSNIVCFLFLFFFYRSQKIRYFSFFKFQRDTLKKDILSAVGIFFASALLVSVPNYLLTILLFDDPMSGLAMLDHGTPLWLLLFSLVALPLTQAFAEIPIYFVYCAPEIQKQKIKPWLAFGLGAIFLSLQHIAMPLVFDSTVILFRSLMFLPFSIFVAFIIYKRPRLLPYMVIIHAILDSYLVVAMLIF